MKISDLEFKNKDRGSGEIVFLFSELLLEDLENYTDDVVMDGDSKTLIFDIY
jgi:hypothetical protein